MTWPMISSVPLLHCTRPIEGRILDKLGSITSHLIWNLEIQSRMTGSHLKWHSSATYPICQFHKRECLPQYQLSSILLDYFLLTMFVRLECLRSVPIYIIKLFILLTTLKFHVHVQRLAPDTPDSKAHAFRKFFDPNQTSFPRSNFNLSPIPQLRKPKETPSQRIDSASKDSVQVH